MKLRNKNKIFIVLPIYNDWISLNRLLKDLNKHAKKNSLLFNILIINDCSSKIGKINLKNLDKIKKLEILNLKKNCGNQVAIAIGLRFLVKKKNVSKIIVMDSDGEDDPYKINTLITKLKNNKKKFVFASRAKRKENIFLKFLNNIRLVFSFILTWKYINYGNFSCFNYSELKRIVDKKDLFLAYCSSATNFSDIIKVPIKKNSRYQGLSKANFKFLFIHSLNIISVFKKRILLISIFYLFLIFLIYFFNYNYYYDEKKVLNIITFLLIFSNIVIFCINYFKKDVLYFEKFIKNILKIK